MDRSGPALSTCDDEKVDEDEVAELLGRLVQQLRSIPYPGLVQRLIGQGPEWTDHLGASGTRYNVQIQGFWDAGRSGPIRVMVSVDDGGKRWRKPTVRDFIVAEDGSFIDE
jgi:hypothetical protein